jgi:hypothetical protein
MNLARTDAMMTIDQHLTRTAGADAHEPHGLASLWCDVRQWLRTCSRYYEAAAVYEDLARLSDAELARRGLSRGSLAREVCSLCERRE